jgi:hypothetical protein
MTIRCPVHAHSGDGGVPGAARTVGAGAGGGAGAAAGWLAWTGGTGGSASFRSLADADA